MRPARYFSIIQLSNSRVFHPVQGVRRKTEIVNELVFRDVFSKQGLIKGLIADHKMHLC